MKMRAGLSSGQAGEGRDQGSITSTEGTKASSALICQLNLRPVGRRLGGRRDVCFVQSFTDASGRIIFIITGLNAPGTQAGAIWFVKKVMADPASYANSVYVVAWNDLSTQWTAVSGFIKTGNNNGFVNYDPVTGEVGQAGRTKIRAWR